MRSRSKPHALFQWGNSVTIEQINIPCMPRGPQKIWFLRPTCCLLMLFCGRRFSAGLVSRESQHLDINPQTEQHKRWHDHNVFGTVHDRRATDGVPVHVIRWRTAARHTVEVKVRLVVVREQSHGAQCLRTLTQQDAICGFIILGGELSRDKMSGCKYPVSFFSPRNFQGGFIWRQICSRNCSGLFGDKFSGGFFTEVMSGQCTGKLSEVGVFIHWRITSLYV